MAREMRKTILFFGLIAGAMMMLFQLSKFSLGSGTDQGDVFIVLGGGLFIVMGFLINRLMSQPTKSKPGRSYQSIGQQTDLSKQEHKVLQLMAEGLSNIEIAENLFISQNTVKTHVSRVLSKLNAKRRTEAVKIGRDLEII